MPDEDQRSRNAQVRVVVSKDAIAERLAQLPTRKEMYRAVLLGLTTGACLGVAVPLIVVGPLC
jgi:hypothetical protein